MNTKYAFKKQITRLMPCFNHTTGFLILDDALYHFGASFKDLGKRLFAFELMGIDKEIILNQ